MSKKYLPIETLVRRAFMHAYKSSQSNASTTKIPRHTCVCMIASRSYHFMKTIEDDEGIFCCCYRGTNELFGNR